MNDAIDTFIDTGETAAAPAETDPYLVAREINERRKVALDVNAKAAAEVLAIEGELERHFATLDPHVALHIKGILGLGKAKKTRADAGKPRKSRTREIEPASLSVPAKTKRAA